MTTASQYEVQAATIRTDKDNVVYIYGSVQKSPPLQTDRLADIVNLSSSQNQDSNREYKQLNDQEDPLLSHKITCNNSLNSSAVDESVSSQSVSFWSSHTDVSIQTSPCRWLLHPKIRENWKIVAGSFLLTLLGTVLFIAGIGIIISPSRGFHVLVFFVVGFLCFVPGCYHLVYIYFAITGKPGYNFYNLPVIH